jgi:hypothetical protein
VASEEARCGGVPKSPFLERSTWFLLLLHPECYFFYPLSYFVYLSGSYNTRPSCDTEALPVPAPLCRNHAAHAATAQHKFLELLLVVQLPLDAITCCDPSPPTCRVATLATLETLATRPGCNVCLALFECLWHEPTCTLHACISLSSELPAFVQHVPTILPALPSCQARACCCCCRYKCQDNYAAAMIVASDGC